MSKHYIQKELTKKLGEEYDRYLAEGSPGGYIDKDKYIDILIAYAINHYLTNAK